MVPAWEAVSTFFNDDMSFQFEVYLRRKKKKRLFGLIHFGVFVCFGIALLPCKAPQNFILRSCVKATLCRENLLRALVDVHMDSVLRGGTSGGHDRRL